MENEKIKVVVIDEDENFISDINNHFCLNNNIQIEKTFTDSESAIEYLVNNKVDIIITDLLMKKYDGYSVMEKVNNFYRLNKPKFIVCSNLVDEMFVIKAMNLGAKHYYIKPVSMLALEQKICDVNNDNTATYHTATYVNSKRGMEEKISHIFISVGIPAHIKGYKFLREAIKMSIEDPNIINSITKRLYPTIAEKFETSASKVERAIRHAIEVAWNRGKIENINSLFGVTVYSSNDKPTNGEFIALVADKMLMEGA